jgi:nucleotide-binding universal stress UspA family protein
MIKKILVPLDGSAAADRILVLARMLLVQEDTDVVLLRVTADDPAEQAVALAHLKARASELSRQGARVRVAIAVADDPAEGILRFASELGPSLIVTSTHGDSSSARWIRGSVAERILQRTEYPVLLANPLSLVHGDLRPLDFRRILVPIDGSELGTRVLPLVKNVAKLCGSLVLLLHVVTRRERDAAATTVAEAEALLEAHEGKHLEAVKTRRLIAEGNPAAAILDAVETEKPDLVALTTHGRGGSSPWTFGSVAEQVLRHCASPLLVHRTAGFAASPRRDVPAVRAPLHGPVG